MSLHPFPADADRGAGRTSRQIAEAPQNAVFVCPSVGFARSHVGSLPAARDREDLKFVGPDFETLRIHTRGTNRQIVVDHAVFEMRLLTAAEMASIEQHNAGVRLRMGVA